MSKDMTFKKKFSVSEIIRRNRESNGYLLKSTIGKYAYIIFRGFLLFGLCFLILQPLINKVSVSFMIEKDLYDSTVISIPSEFTLENYQMINTLIKYPSSFRDTFLIAIGVSLLQIISCTLVGYGFARFKFPLKNMWFAFVILVILIPPQTIMSSLYLHFRFFDILGIFNMITGSPLNLLNSLTPYLLMSATCMGLKNGLYIYMVRQYFRGLPKEIEEAAYVDGCGKIRTFVQIMLPDARPIITSCFLFAFVWQWTDSFYSSLFMRNINLLPNNLRVIHELMVNHLERTVGAGASPTMAYSQQLIATGMLMFIAPLIVLYLIAQRGFVESLSSSGIKM